MNKPQITPKWKINSKDFEFDPLKLPTHISYNLKKSFYLLSWKSLSFQMEFKSFQNPFHFIKWKKSCHILSRVLYLKRIWIYGDHKSKMKVWESPFIPSHLTFKSFKFHSISHKQSNNHSKLFIYYNIPKFRILGCYRKEL